MTKTKDSPPEEDGSGEILDASSPMWGELVRLLGCQGSTARVQHAYDDGRSMTGEVYGYDKRNGRDAAWDSAQRHEMIAVFAWPAMQQSPGMHHLPPEVDSPAISPPPYCTEFEYGDFGRRGHADST